MYVSSRQSDSSSLFISFSGASSEIYSRVGSSFDWKESLCKSSLLFSLVLLLQYVFNLKSHACLVSALLELSYWDLCRPPSSRLSINILAPDLFLLPLILTEDINKMNVTTTCLITTTGTIAPRCQQPILIIKCQHHLHELGEVAVCSRSTTSGFADYAYHSREEKWSRVSQDSHSLSRVYYDDEG